MKTCILCWLFTLRLCSSLVYNFTNNTFWSNVSSNVHDFLVTNALSNAVSNATFNIFENVTLRINNRSNVYSGKYLFHGIDKQTSVIEFSFNLNNPGYVTATNCDAPLLACTDQTSMEFSNLTITYDSANTESPAQHAWFFLDIIGKVDTNHLILSNVDMRDMNVCIKYIDDVNDRNNLIRFSGYNDSSPGGYVLLENINVINIFDIWKWKRIFTFEKVYNLSCHNVYIDNVANFSTILIFEGAYGWNFEHDYIISMENVEMYNMFNLIEYVFKTTAVDEIAVKNIHFENITITNSYGAFWYLKTVRGRVNITNMTIKNTFVEDKNIICWDEFYEDVYLDNIILDNIGTNGASVVWITIIKEGKKLIINNFSILNNNNKDIIGNYNNNNNKMGIVFDFEYLDAWGGITGGCQLSNIIFESNVFQTRIFRWDACDESIELNGLKSMNNEYLISDNFEYAGGLISRISNQSNITLTDVYFGSIIINFANDSSSDVINKKYNLLTLTLENLGDNDGFIRLNGITIKNISVHVLNQSGNGVVVVDHAILTQCELYEATAHSNVTLYDLSFSHFEVNQAFISVHYSFVNGYLYLENDVSFIEISDSKSFGNGMEFYSVGLGYNYNSFMLMDILIQDSYFNNSILYLDDCYDITIIDRWNVTSSIVDINTKDIDATYLIQITYSSYFKYLGDWEPIVSILNSSFTNYGLGNTVLGISVEYAPTLRRLLNERKLLSSVSYKYVYFLFEDVVFENISYQGSSSLGANSNEVDVGLINIETSYIGIRFRNVDFITNNNWKGVIVCHENTNCTIELINCVFKYNINTITTTTSNNSMSANSSNNNINTNTSSTTTTTTTTTNVIWLDSGAGGCVSIINSTFYGNANSTSVVFYNQNDSNITIDDDNDFIPPTPSPTYSPTNIPTKSPLDKEITDSKTDNDDDWDFWKWLESMNTMELWIVVIVSLILFLTCFGALFVFIVVKRKGAKSKVKNNNNNNKSNNKIKKPKKGTIDSGDDDMHATKGEKGRKGSNHQKGTVDHAMKWTEMHGGHGYLGVSSSSGPASPTIPAEMINAAVKIANNKNKNNSNHNNNVDGSTKGTNNNKYGEMGGNININDADVELEDGELQLEMEGAGDERNRQIDARIENRMYEKEIEKKFNIELNKALETKRKENFGESLKQQGLEFENVVMDDIVDHMKTNK